MIHKEWQKICLPFSPLILRKSKYNDARDQLIPEIHLKLKRESLRRNTDGRNPFRKHYSDARIIVI